jgi:hypothetical protein
MSTLMDSLKNEEDILDREQEESHGEYGKLKLVFEKRNNLYKRFLKKEGLAELDRLRLENKSEWYKSHLLQIIIGKEIHDKITDLTKRMYRLEKNAGLE